MRVEEVMDRDFALVAPEATVQEAARLMADMDAKALPVGGPGRKVDGILTDRDILLRVVAQGLACETTPVSQVMSAQVVACPPDADLDQVRADMQRRQIRRMPVVGADGVMVGMLVLV